MGFFKNLKKAGKAFFQVIKVAGKVFEKVNKFAGKAIPIIKFSLHIAEFIPGLSGPATKALAVVEKAERGQKIATQLIKSAKVVAAEVRAA